MCKIVFVAYIDFKSIAEQLAGGIFCELPKEGIKLNALAIRIFEEYLNKVSKD